MNISLDGSTKQGFHRSKNKLKNNSSPLKVEKYKNTKRSRETARFVSVAQQWLSKENFVSALPNLTIQHRVQLFYIILAYISYNNLRK